MSQSVKSKQSLSIPLSLTHYISFSTDTGIDQDDDDYVESASMDEDDEEEDAKVLEARKKEAEKEKEVDKMALKEQKELEAAKRERMELINAEQKAFAKDHHVPNEEKATLQDKFEYLVSQSEVFAHFLAGKY